MKLGFMTSLCPHWSLQEILAAASRYGYGGVEPRIDWGHSHGIETDATKARRRSVKEAFDGAGVAISCLATGIKLAQPTGAPRQEQVDQVLRCTELAADVGAPNLRVFAGGDPGLDGDTRHGYVAETLHRALPAIEGSGVTLLLETHDFFCLGKDVGRALDTVNHPQVMALWDTGHPARNGEDPVDTAGYLQLDRVKHVHTYDLAVLAPGRLQTTWEYGEGKVPLRACLSQLKAAGYPGFLSFEYIVRGDVADHDPAARLASLADRLRALLEDLDETAPTD